MLCLTSFHVCHYLGVVEEAPLHAIALRQVRDGALQHRRVAGADGQVSQVEADALEVQVFLPPASHTPVKLTANFVRVLKVFSFRLELLVKQHL